MVVFQLKPSPPPSHSNRPSSHSYSDLSIPTRRQGDKNNQKSTIQRTLLLPSPISIILSFSLGMATPAINLVMLILSLFIFVALIGWLFQKSIHRFIQALVAYRQQNNQTQSTSHDVEAAERL
ncbi:hypothetical protein J3F83DRAFT_754352 [Trichoderma novae-zelandiae]